MPYSYKLNLKKLTSDKPEIKYCTAKQALDLSGKNPSAFYSKLGVFIPFLDGENRILKWIAILIIGNLASVDKDNQINRLVPKLISFLQGRELITAGNSIKALGKIAQAKPRLRSRIFHALIAVEKARYYYKGKLSPECRNVALGHVVVTLEGFRDEIRNNKEIMSFLKRQTKNTREKVRKNAQALIKKLYG